MTGHGAIFLKKKIKTGIHVWRFKLIRVDDSRSVSIGVHKILDQALQTNHNLYYNHYGL